MPISYESNDTVATGVNAPIIEELKARFDYCVTYWSKIREEGRHDMRCVAGDPWPEKERQARKDADRLCLSLDEINQYLNQTINGVRQNKRAIKVVPEGNGADDKSAEIRAGIIRGIEYKCKAQSAYIRAFENAIQRSYGYVKVKTDYESPRSANQVLKICSIPNPDTIYLDPDAKEADFSDMEYAFEVDSLSERSFVERWPRATIRSFSPDLQKRAPSWIRDGKGGYRIQIASYWKVKSKKRTLIYMPDGRGVFLDEPELKGATIEEVEVGGLGKKTMVRLPSGEVFQAHGHRDSKDNKVIQYITNGLEILEENKWAGKTVPIVPCLGKELWVDDGGGATRMLISLVRMAREAFLMYCYAATAQTEIAGQASRLLYIGYEGQFDTQTPWDQINKTMLAYAEVKATTTEVGAGEKILPLPTKANWEPPIQALEILKQGARQAIQSAMGVSGGLLSGRRGQDRQAKSGIALQELDEQAEQGTFHFVDSYDLMIQQVGRICDDMLDKVYDTPRDVVSIGKDDTPSVQSINQRNPETGEPVDFQVTSGDHGVTISVGPPQQSQHAEASEFAGGLASSSELVAAAITGNKTAADLLALAIRLRQLGPIGDEMADILSPPVSEEEKDLPPAAQNKMQQLTQQLEQAQAIAIELKEQQESEQKKLDNDRELKRMDVEVKREEIASRERIEFAKLGHQGAVKELELDTKRIEGQESRAQAERQAAETMAHESEQAEAGRQHESAEAEAARIAAAQSQEGQQAHAAEMAERGHEQTLEQAEQAADLQPEPAE